MKNFKSFICNTVTFLVSVLFLVFMSQPHFIGVAFGKELPPSSGYQMIDFSSNDGKQVMLAVSLLLATIFACLLLLTSIYGILRSFDVVKANKADKIIRWFNIGVATLFVVFMFLAFIMDISIVAEQNNKLAQISEEILKRASFKPGWGLVVNFVLSIVSLVAICFDKAPKKASKSKKK